MRKGQKMTDEQRERLSQARMGMKFSEEHILHLTKANRLKGLNRIGSKHSVETIEKLRKPKTEEHKRKIKENHARYWKDRLGTLSKLNPYYYKHIHHWIRKIAGYPGICRDCGTIKGVQWANKSQEYLKEISDWIPLCSTCNRKYDIAFFKNKGNNTD